MQLYEVQSRITLGDKFEVRVNQGFRCGKGQVFFYCLHYSQFTLPNQGLFTLGGTVAEW